MSVLFRPLGANPDDQSGLPLAGGSGPSIEPLVSIQASHRLMLGGFTPCSLPFTTQEEDG